MVTTGERRPRVPVEPARDEVAAGLRVVLAAIDAGGVEATDVQRAYLAGALDVLETLTDPDA